jgi:Protein of unknown function DUF262
MKVLNGTVQEDLEPSIFQTITGVEDEEDDGNEFITDPFDPTQIRVTTRNPQIGALLNRIKENELDMAPDFQRQAGIWSDKTQSKLIESILIRIPLPAFYMDALDDDRWLVVDGLQRLTAIDRFAQTKNLILEGLEFLKQLEGKKFDELPRIYQRRILETEVIVYLIDKGTPPEVKFTIFKRINTGGLPLSLQEIRHALNKQQSREFLRELANLPSFKNATTGSISSQRMTDRECVLRFMAFVLTPYTEYASRDLDTFLNSAMGQIDRMHPTELKNLQGQFERAMRIAHVLFEQYAFRKRESLEKNRKLPINKALFEAWSVNLSKLTESQVDELYERQDELIKKSIELINDRAFDKSISLGTGSINNVRERFGRIERLIQEVLR